MAIDYDAITKKNKDNPETEKKILDILRSMYKDPEHFVYEILQNADDCDATEIKFTLEEKRLVIEHDGNPFTKDNVEAISSFGESTSRDDLNKTGKFGVGFKSVFAFTNTPQIHSGEEHFEIYGVSAIASIDPIEIFDKRKTRIILPFNYERISPEDAVNLISDKLQDIGIRTLLFTEKLKEIKWFAPGDKKGRYHRKDGKLSKNGYRPKQRTVMSDDIAEPYIMFPSPPIEWEDEKGELKKHKPVDIAFRLDTAKKGIVPLKDSKLTVLFPTEIETRIGFIMNGPYKTNPPRENVNKGDEFNLHLAQKTAQLLCESLRKIKGMGMLSIDVLNTLPMRTDDFVGEDIVDAICKLLDTEDFLPADDGTFVSGQNAKLGGAGIIDLLGNDKLNQLYPDEGTNFKWLSRDIPTEKNRDLRVYLKDELKIEEVSSVTFARKITKEFLEQQDNSWMIKFYDYLMKHEILWRKSRKLYGRYISEGILRSKEIIRLSDGSHVKPFKDYGEEPAVFLPHSPDKIEYPEVHPEIARDETALEFLRRLGLEKVGQKEVINSILEKYYAQRQDYHKDIPHHIEHIKEFISFWRKDKPKAEDIFRFKYIFRNQQGCLTESYKLYIDSPIEETGLRFIFTSKENYRYPLWKKYEGIKGFVDFATGIGAIDKLPIRKMGETDIYDGIRHTYGGEIDIDRDRDSLAKSKFQKKYKDGWNQTTTVGHSDWYIGYPKIDKLLSRNCKDTSRVIWDLMRNANPKVLESSYYPNETHIEDKVTADSSLVEDLKKHEWVPLKSGDGIEFVKPADASENALADGFEYDDRNRWLTAIGFGETARTKAEVQFRESAAYEDQRNEEFSRLPLEEKDKLLALIRKPEFPSDDDDTNMGRRATKQQERASDLPDKKYENRTRSVRVSSPEVDEKIYLLDRYTNDEDKMVCQICEYEMPFKKRDGYYYFEAVEILTIKEEVNKEEASLYLALCPVCAAKYKEFIKRCPKAMQRFHNDLISSTNSNTNIEVSLDTKQTVRFRSKHLADVQDILKGLANGKAE